MIFRTEYEGVGYDCPRCTGLPCKAQPTAAPMAPHVSPVGEWRSLTQQDSQ